MRSAWYVIAWRLVWALPFYFSVALVCFLVLLMWGPSHAARVWKDIT
jgi:hypothetical protein